MELSTTLLAWGTATLLTIAVVIFKRASLAKALRLTAESKKRQFKRQYDDKRAREALNLRREELKLSEELEQQELVLTDKEEALELYQAEQTAQERQHEIEIQAIDQELDELEENVNDLGNTLIKTRDRAADLQSHHTHQLETIALTNAEAVTQELISSSKGNYLSRLEQRKAQDKEDNERKGPLAARRILGLTLNRYDGIGHLERVTNQFEMPPKAFEVLRDSSTPMAQQLSEELDVELWDRGSNVIGIRGENPLGREAARRVLTRLSQNWTTDSARVERLCHRVSRQLDNEVFQAGNQAIRSLEMENVHPDIVSLVGRLKFRLSYSQNQLLHAVEVARLSGLLAKEMGLNVKDAMRGGLLHDIGKAMTHDHEGSHAVLGAEVARRCGEAEIIANAIGSHHNDEPMNSPIAYIVTAADALSGARPGARRETASLYLARMQQLSDIAHGSSKGLERVDIMHAGREIRLAVPGSERMVGEKSKDSQYDDASMIELAEDVARTIEEEVVYPGQIRVTVIRESRASAVAR
ncbi:MAG: HDIG domain-containing metalloprotein [Myxococcota bacterium]|nr:HDIG domain-containing metalloprotein [Myxococcota bacterium]